MRIVIDLQGAQSQSRFRGIGRYSRSLAKAIARNAGKHEVIIALSDRFPETIIPIRHEFAGLVPKERIIVFSVPGPVAECNPANSRRARTAELIREHFLQELKPDVVLITSLFEGFVDDAVTSVKRFDQNTKTAVVFYDLIPFLNPDQYLCDPVYKEYYNKKIDSLKKADILLSISESAGTEAINALSLSHEKVVNISTAIEESFSSKSNSNDESINIHAQYGLHKPYVMHMGAIEPRKNYEALIKAFSMLEKKIREKYQLFLVAQGNDAERDRLHKLALSFGLKNNDIVITGYVPDEDLCSLFTSCALFVFPSLHEGFGLPALEAMACGAPTIGSNSTSIPEVIGREDALFDPHSVASIASAMTKALTDEDYRKSLKAHGLKQAKKFSWDISAKRAIKALESSFAGNYNNVVNEIASSNKPKLAFISPLPPERSGISYYSAELLPYLAKYYDIELIVDRESVDLSLIKIALPVRNVQFFIDNHDKYERVLYHFGNSPFHKHMFDLLEKYPGVVVLHDFFLSSLMRWMDHSGYRKETFTNELYRSHGYSALLSMSKDDIDNVIINFPCSKGVLQAALGTIVHSKYAMGLAAKYYGTDIREGMVLVPQLRATDEAVDSSRARDELGISHDVFLVCSFGHLDFTKLNHCLLDAWLSSSLSQNKKCQLVFVGQNNGGKYGQYLLTKIDKSGRKDNIKITGYVDHEVFKSYLSAADVAVQLRTGSRGETSRAVLDVLACGLPLIINAHGPMAEYPDDILIKLPDEFAGEELTNSLEKLWQDEALKRRLSKAGKRYIKKYHDPGSIAEQYHKAIETFNVSSSVLNKKKIVDAVAEVAYPLEISEQDLINISNSIAGNSFNKGSNQLLIDVSAIIKNDLKTGIERVTRFILMELIKDPPLGYRIEPVYARDGKYYYARKFTFNILGVNEPPITDQIINVNRGDVFLGLDWAPDAVEKNKDLLQIMRQHGVAIHFVIYDILPVTNPEWFPSFMAEPVTNWLNNISGLADSCMCISKATSDSLKHWIDINNTLAVKPSIKWFHMGADIAQGLSAKEIPKEAINTLRKIKQHSSFLMVGTIEPRKMHAQVLKAFEILWSQGVDVDLVIVGHEGWKNVPDTERVYIRDLVKKLNAHPKMNKSLFWLNSISDDFLLEAYKASSALIAASGDEGFGLPLIEAAQHKLPIIARDIPVFREVAGEYAYYFVNSTEPQVISDAIQKWLKLYKLGNHPKSDDIPRLTWEQSAKMLLERILDKQMRCSHEI